MHGDDVIAHRKADACAAAFGAALIKLLLDEGQLFLLDALTEVPDMDDAAAVLGVGAHLHPVAVLAVFAGVVDDVEEDLLEPVAVGKDHNRLFRLFILDAHTLLLKHIGVGKHRVVQVATQIKRLGLQPHTAALDAGKVQQLLHHLGKPPGLLFNDGQTLCRQLGIVQAAFDGVGPAGDGGQRCPQLVGHRGNKIVLGLFHPGKLGGHIVQRAAKLADLVVIVGVQPDAVLSAGDFLGKFVDVQHRPHDGAQEKAVGENNQRHQQCHRQNHPQIDLPQLSVQHLQGGDAAHRSDQPSAAVIHRCGGGHNLFLGQLIVAGVGFHLSALQCPGNLAGLGGKACRQATGGHHDLARFVQNLDLHLIGKAEALHQIASVFVKGAVAGAEIAVEVLGCGVGLPLQTGLHRGVEIIGTEHGHQCAHQQQDQNDHAHIVDEPAAADAALQPQTAQRAFFTLFRVVFCHAGSSFLSFYRFNPRREAGGGTRGNWFRPRIARTEGARHFRRSVCDQPSHLYPYPHTVVICLGWAASSSIFRRRRRIFTSTTLMSP